MPGRRIAAIAGLLALLAPAASSGKGFDVKPPGDAGAAYARAERALTADDVEGARRELERVMEQAPDYAPAYGLYKATFNRDPAGRRAAAERFRTLVAANPNRAGYLYALGRLSTDTDERQKTFDALARLEPDSAWSYAGLGLMGEIKNDTKVAVTNYEKAHAIAPADPEIASMLVPMLLSDDVGRRADALKIFEEIVKTAPESYWTEDVFAEVTNSASGAEELALAKRYLALFPRGRYAVGTYRTQLDDLATKDKTAAAARAREAIAALPGARYAEGRGMLFEAYVLAPAAAEGQPAIDRLAAELLGSKEDSPQVFLALAGFYDRESADHALALKLDTRAFELATSTKASTETADRARLLAGHTSLWSGDAKQAASYLEPIATAELLPSATAALGDAYTKLGDVARAYDAFVRAVAAEPSPDRNKRLAAAAKTAGHSDSEARAAVWAARAKTAKPASDFTLAALGGGEVALASLRGKVVLLNFWFPG